MLSLPFPSTLLAATLMLALSAGCAKDSKEEPRPHTAATAEVKYTFDGTAYAITDAREVSAIYEACSNRIFISANPIGRPGVSFGLTATGAGDNVREFQQGTMADDRPFIAELTRYDHPTATKPIFSTLYGPDSSNGQIIITECDLKAGKLSGTFTFTGGAMAHTGAAGTATVSGGSFRFTRLTKI